MICDILTKKMALFSIAKYINLVRLVKIFITVFCYNWFMKKILVSDFSRVLLFPKDEIYRSGLNKLYGQTSAAGDRFEDYFKLNEALLIELEKLEIDKYIFTTGTVQDAPEIKDRVKAVFKKVFNVPMIGVRKADSRAYLKLCSEIGAEPVQVMFIDDTSANVEAAKEAGLHAVVYENNEQILDSINKWLK